MVKPRKGRSTTIQEASLGSKKPQKNGAKRRGEVKEELYPAMYPTSVGAFIILKYFQILINFAESQPRNGESHQLLSRPLRVGQMDSELI